VMLGQGIWPKSYHHLARMMQPGQLQRALSDLKAGIAAQIAKLPDHEQFVQGYAPAA
jgi:tryptophan halogenase